MIVLRQKEYDNNQEGSWFKRAGQTIRAAGKEAWEQEKQEWKEHPWKKGLSLAGELALWGLTAGVGGAALTGIKAARAGAKGVKAYNKVRKGAGLFKNAAATTKNLGTFTHNVVPGTKAVGKAVSSGVKNVVANPTATAKKVGNWALNTTKNSVTAKGMVGMQAANVAFPAVGLSLSQAGSNLSGEEGPLTQRIAEMNNKSTQPKVASMVPVRPVQTRTQPQQPTTQAPVQKTANLVQAQKPVIPTQTQKTSNAYTNAAKDIWAGKWGNGHDVRMAKAKELGLDYNKLRQQVNNYKV